jgi:N-acetylmuramoyl-L-alanine amidase
MLGRVRIFFFCLLCLSLFSYVIISISPEPVSEAFSKSQGNNGYTLIIDAGHGGSDGGAVASDGTEEAQINLEIAQKLNDFLSLMGYRTVMTRTDENSIGEKGVSIRNEKVSDIRRRFEIIENTENCIFISIHQNFYSGSSSWGTQVFYSANNPESKKAALSIQSSIVNLLQPDNKRQIKPSGKDIYLLYHTQKPAVLVECGFISNQQDLIKLKDAQYQKEIAFCIMCGITDYIKDE